MTPEYGQTKSPKLKKVISILSCGLDDLDDYQSGFLFKNQELVYSETGIRKYHQIQAKSY